PCCTYAVPLRSTLFPYTTLFRSVPGRACRRPGRSPRPAARTGQGSPAAPVAAPSRQLSRQGLAGRVSPVPRATVEDTRGGVPRPVQDAGSSHGALAVPAHHDDGAGDVVGATCE